ncbi:MAG: hypothetical protein RR034_03580, partial [Bacteroidales bacterium]
NIESLEAQAKAQMQPGAFGYIRGGAEDENNLRSNTSAFDKKYIKQAISDNSIVYSSLDLDLGKELFNNCFQEGEKAVKIIEKGGDFKFVRYYYIEKKHHIVFRTYDDFIVNFYDYIVDTADAKIKIKDGFIYNLSNTFINDVRSSMLYSIMQHTNPDRNHSEIKKVIQLMENHRYSEALKILEKEQKSLKIYPMYWQLYLSNLYKCNSGIFIKTLDQLQKEGLDERYILLHKLFFLSNTGNISETENIINRLIPFSGDDPIYLLFYGKANYNAKNYQDALICYESAEEVMPLLWDLWYGKLECYDKLNDRTGFHKTLEKGENAYKMSKDELLQLTNQYFPKMIK